MKKLLAIFLSVLMLTACLPLGAVSVSAATYGKLTYTVSGGEVTITDCDTSASGALTIPSTINGYPVTSIGDSAFRSCDSLTSVTIPDSVTTIGKYAFLSCYSLTSVTIPDSVTTIGDSAFESCDSLTSVTIGDNVTTIEESAFQECTSLTSVTIPDSVTTIGDRAFYNCDSLTSVTIGNSVTTIGYQTFSNCISLPSVTIPDSVTSIGEFAFSNCTSLTSVTIGNSVTTIEKGAFSACSSIDVDENNPNYCDVDGVLFNKEKTTLIQHPSGKFGAYTIPDSVTTIGWGAFYDCSSLTSVTIPNSVTTIEEWAFYNCTSLTSVTIPDNVTTIGEWAFIYCYDLTSVTIPDSVTTIGWGAFSDCYSLTTVHYHGTEADKAAISIGYSNDELISATWHYYDNGCDTVCNDCGTTREPLHEYANACDSDCNVCGVTREPSHNFDDEYDANCNTCGLWREVPERPGDANGDGKANNQDLGLLQQYLNEREVEIAVHRMDVDGNGRVNNMDLGILQRYINGWDVELSPVRPAVELPATPHDVDGKGRIFVESVTLDGNTVTVLFTNRHKKWISEETAYIEYVCTDAAGNVLTTDDKFYGSLHFGMLEVGASRQMTFTLPEGTAKMAFGDAHIFYWTQWA